MALMEEYGEFSHNRQTKSVTTELRSVICLQANHEAFSLHVSRFLSCLVLAASLLAGNNTLADQAVDLASRSIQLALSTEPPDLNSLTSTDSVSFFVLLHTQEGLLTYGENDELTAGVASHWRIHDTTVEFTLRDDAKWCDGKKVTAQDFIFAWQSALNPAMASRYAFILYALKNAEKIHRGLLPVSALGVHATDSTHLSVELERPTAYFLSLTTFPTYFPVREDFYRAQQGRYGADADKLLCNGAFKLTEWTHGATLTLERNLHYWNAGEVSLQRIRIPHITNDPNTLFNLFQSGDIAMAELSQDTVQQALQQRLFIQDVGNGMLTYLEFNQRDSNPLRNVNLRRAIALSIDRSELVNKVIASAGTQATANFFPAWLPSTIQKFGDTPEDNIQNLHSDTPAARVALQRAKFELATENIPPLHILIYDSPAVVRQAEYFQRELQQKLGLTLIIDKQIFKQKLAKLAAGDFDIALSAWGPDYNDTMTFADLLGSTNENNHGHYRNAEYDQLLTQAASLSAGSVRDAIFESMQTIIHKDVAVFPLTEPGTLYVQDKKLCKVTRRRFGGDPDLRFAKIQNEELQP